MFSTTPSGTTGIVLVVVAGASVVPGSDEEPSPPRPLEAPVPLGTFVSVVDLGDDDDLVLGVFGLAATVEETRLGGLVVGCRGGAPGKITTVGAVVGAGFSSWRLVGPDSGELLNA